MPEATRPGLPQLTPEDFEHLLAFRVSLRRFQHWSEDQARAAGLTHAQHQLLVAVKGHPATSLRPWANSPITCSCATTARWNSWTGPRRPGWFGGVPMPTTLASSG